MKYVMSDIHGNYDGYIAMKDKIHLCKDDKLIIVGDVIDRRKACKIDHRPYTCN